RRLIDEFAPERIRLPGGRQVRVHYEPDQPPWIASRLQDFFGLRATPTVGRGVPVVVRLLAPNNRPVQMTTDLEGFWTRLYPQPRLPTAPQASARRRRRERRMPRSRVEEYSPHARTTHDSCVEIPARGTSPAASSHRAADRPPTRE